MSQKKDDRLHAVMSSPAASKRVEDWMLGLPPHVVGSPSYTADTQLSNDSASPLSSFQRRNIILRLREILREKNMAAEYVQERLKQDRILRLTFPTLELAEEFSELIYTHDTICIGDGAVENGVGVGTKERVRWEQRGIEIEGDKFYFTLFIQNENRNEKNQNEILILEDHGIRFTSLLQKKQKGFFDQGQVDHEPCCRCVIL